MAPSLVTEEKTEDKQIEPPVPEEVVKTYDTYVVDVPFKENLEVAQDPICEPDTSNVPKTVVDVVESQPEKQLAIDSVKNEPKEKPEMDSVKTQTEEQPAMVDVPESSVEVLEKQEEPLEVSPVKEPVLEKQEEPLEVCPVKEPEAIVAKEREDSEAESIKEEKPEPAVSKVEEKAGEVFEKQEEPLEVSPVKEGEAIVVKETEESEAEPTKAEKPESAIPQVEEKRGEPTGVIEQVEKICEEVELKESVAGETEKEGTLADKAEDTTILKKEQTSKDQELSASESSDQVVSIAQEPEADLKGDGGDYTLPNVIEKVGMEDTEKANVIEGSISTAEVIEKSFEGENTSRDVELLAENKKEEDVEIEKPPSIKPNKDGNITAVYEQVGETQEPKLEVKAEETVKAGEEDSEKEKVDATAKSDVPNLEPSSKDGDDTKTSHDLPKEAPAKPAQKQSNNIITKVKKSLVKAKRAIIGKSPSSKTLSSETKGDIAVK
ncbi:hypothetical protein L1049_020660 [Liquidambar formosana]|uniref:Uncharacterized protein n=1 Tax=Liquidambar formosana TaxID=63359 RepID=A0AAP0SDF3_LIQFO